jgi:hypothetical protein
VDTPLLKIVLVSAVTMGLSHTISRERIFEPLRTAFGGAAVLRVGFCFIDEEGRLAKTKKRVTQVEAESRERALQ